jgi:hypothetical protein
MIRYIKSASYSKRLLINFNSYEDVFINDIYKIKVNNKNYYFQVNFVYCNKDGLNKVVAKEIEFYNSAIKDKLALKDIVNSELFYVDEEMLNEIVEDL